MSQQFAKSNTYSVFGTPHIFVTTSAKTRPVCTPSELKKKNLSIISSVQGMDHQSLSVVSSFGITALDSRKGKIMDLYSDYTENKLQALTFAAITSVCTGLQCCNLA